MPRINFSTWGASAGRYDFRPFAVASQGRSGLEAVTRSIVRSVSKSEGRVEVCAFRHDGHNADANHYQITLGRRVARNRREWNVVAEFWFAVPRNAEG